MPEYLLELPRELIYKIFSVLDDASILKMREVSHLTKKFAEEFVLSFTKEAFVEILSLHKEKDSNIKVQFDFLTGGQSLIHSKILFVSSISYYQVTAFNLNAEIHSEKLTAILTPSHTIQLFNTLSSLMGIVNCKALMLSPITPEMFSLTGNFFDGKTVSELVIKLNNLEETEDFVLNLVCQLRSTAMWIKIKTLPNATFLHKLAESVDAIAMQFIGDFNGRHSLFSMVDTAQFLSQLLQRRCSYLELSKAFIEISMQQAMMLSTKLHADIGSKMFFIRARTTENSIRREHSFRQHVIEVIEYSDKVDRRNVIEISHKQLTKRYW